MTAARDHAKVRDGTWQARAWPTMVLIAVGMSQKSPLVGGPANLLLRQALSYAVDRAAVIAAKDAASTPATGLVPDGILHDDAGGLAYPHDADKARRLARGDRAAARSPLPLVRGLGGVDRRPRQQRRRPARGMEGGRHRGRA